MKHLSIILLLLLTCSFVLSTPTTLVGYFDQSPTSHACNPGYCNYPNAVLIDSNYAKSCAAGGIKVLGLNDNTNAHAEINTLNNYKDVNICMINSIFDPPTKICKYANPGESCGAHYNCLFGLSDATNAHLSKCNTFSNEIKFCCKFPIISQPQTCNSSFFEENNLKDFNYESTIRFKYACTGNPKINTDANIELDFGQGKKSIIDLNGTNDCNSTQKTFDFNTANWINIGGYSYKQATLILNPKNSCETTQYTFYIRQTTPSQGSITCDIKSISAKRQNNEVVSAYSCWDNIDGNLVILNKDGKIICEKNLIKCKTDTNTTNVCGDLNFGVYEARLTAGNCTKGAYFSYSKETQATIPDYNAISIIILLGAITLIMYKPKKYISRK